MKLHVFLLSAFFFWAAHALAETIYVETKNYKWQWGEAPNDPDKGLDQLRTWLEERAVPELRPAPEGVKKALARKLKLEGITVIKGAVAGPPRSTHGRMPVLYYWVEWVSKATSALDQGDKRYQRNSGLAKLEVVGFGEKTLELMEFYPEEELKSRELDRVVPWDAAVVAKKLIEYHANRPRHKNDRVNGRGRASAY